MKNNKLQSKDLINIGIFTAIYFVITAAVTMLSFIPIFYPLTAALVPLVGGVPFMLYLTKIKKFGMILIMSLICGILMILTGMGYWALLTSAIVGLIAELIIKSGNYSSAKKSVFAYGVFSIWTVGNFFSFYVARDAYLALVTEKFGPDYASALTAYFPTWSLPVFAVAAFGFGIIGGLIGKSIMKKHFQRGGIV